MILSTNIMVGQSIALDDVSGPSSCPLTASGVTTASGMIAEADIMAELGTPPADGAAYQIGCDVAVESITFDLGHSWAGDLEDEGIVLVAPSGETITLYTDGAAAPAVEVECPEDEDILLADGDCLPVQTIEIPVDILSPPMDLMVDAGASDVFNFTQGAFMTCPADVVIGADEVIITGVNTSAFFTGGAFPCDRDNCEDANDLDNVQTRQIFAVPAGFNQVSFDWSTVNEYYMRVDSNS